MDFKAILALLRMNKMKNLMFNISDAYDLLSLLKEKVSTENYSISKHLFRGADITILPKYHEYVNQKAHWLDNDVRIVTPYAFELSWVIFQIKDVFYDHNLMDAQSKYFVFGNLGTAAIDYHTNNGDGDVVDLLIHIINESQNLITTLFSNDNIARA